MVSSEQSTKYISCSMSTFYVRTKGLSVSSEIPTKRSVFCSFDSGWKGGTVNGDSLLSGCPSPIDFPRENCSVQHFREIWESQQNRPFGRPDIGLIKTCKDWASVEDWGQIGNFEPKAANKVCTHPACIASKWKNQLFWQDMKYPLALEYLSMHNVPQIGGNFCVIGPILWLNDIPHGLYNSLSSS